MEQRYPHIFEPLAIKNMTLKNRIVMCPMGSNFGKLSGEMSFEHIEYYAQRARGGVGLIIMENASVDSPTGSNGTTQLRLDHDGFIPRLHKLCEAVHLAEGRIAVQINHAGASASESRTGVQPVSASDVPTKDGGDIPRPLEVEEIYQNVKRYGQAAKRAVIAGFDAVEIHGGHSYLISQFLSPLTNHRDDEFPDDATGKNVVVVGGGAVGLDVVEFFANRGASCSIVEMLPTIGNGLDPVSKVAFNTMMDEHDVKRLANTALAEVRADRFLVRDEQGEFELPFDCGFVCLGMKAFNPVLEELERAYADDNSAKIVNIGDSSRARRIIEGTEEGRNVLMALEKRGFL